MLTVEKSSQTLVFFVIDNFVKSLLQNLGLTIKRIFIIRNVSFIIKKIVKKDSENERTMCENERTIPENEATMCENERTIPENETTMGENERTIPENETTTGENERTMCVIVEEGQ